MSSSAQQIYEQLDKLDDYLADKTPSERTLFGFIVGAVIAALMYFALYDLSSNYKYDYESAHNRILGELTKEQEYIDSMDNGGFLALEQQINSINGNIAQARDTLKRLQGLINDVYDSSKDWFLTFDEASKRAINLGLTVNGTDIELADTTSLGGMKPSNFVLFGYGRYENILKYLDWLETFGQFVSIDRIIIESKDNRLNFSVLIRNFRGGV